MRIGIVVVAKWSRFSISLEDLGLSLQALGHEAILVCRGDEGGDCRIPLVVASAEEEASVEFWRGLRLDLAICFTNLHWPQILRAIRAAGAQVISRADSDGQFSYRIFPRAAFIRQVHPASNVIDALRRFRHFVNCYRTSYRRVDGPVLEVLSLSSAVIIETAAARANVALFLARHGRGDLLPRVHVVSHAVADCFLEEPVKESPPLRIFCAGRWENDQKNAPWLVAIIRKILADHPSVEFIVTGTGAAQAFAGIAERKRLRLLDRIPNREVPRYLDDCCLILSSSRWEGQPISALEALCRGRTVVGPPWPGFLDLVDGGKFGQVSKGYSIHALVAATSAELECWKSGRRSAAKIAEFWRPRVTNLAVARGILAASRDGA